MPKKIYVIAGEASGDLHGANLIRHLKAEASAPLEIYGVGGERIRQTGALNFFDLAHFHVTGMTEALRRLPQYWNAAAVVLKGIREAQPDAVVLIDNPGFNLHLAQKIHALGIPIVYYIAPQVWAWAPKRILKIKKFISKVLVVFEFEKKIYEKEGIPVSWVGHPLKDLIGKEFPEPTKKNGDFQICLLPGSRKGELKHLMKVFLGAAALLKKKFETASFVLIRSSALPKAFYERLLKQAPIPVRLAEENAYSEIKASALAIACSGTVTLECALLETPMVIANKSTFLTYALAKRLIRVPYLGLPNLVLGQKKFPELLQYDATPEKIAEEATRIISEPAVRESMKRDLKEVSGRIGEPGATRRAALEILQILQNG